MPVPQSPYLPDRQTPAIADSRLSVANGFLMLAVGLALLVFSVLFGAFQVALLGSAQFSLMTLGLAIFGIIASFIILNGLVVLQPNTSLVCLLFGSYVGTLKRSGFRWVNPFNSKTKVTRRLETLECGPLKVNDAVGNPIDIGAVIVWRVQDAAKAILEVEVLCALREGAKRDGASPDGEHPSLRSGGSSGSRGTRQGASGFRERRGPSSRYLARRRRCCERKPAIGATQENGADWHRGGRSPHIAPCLLV